MGLTKASWIKTLYQWHWISSALCLAGMLMFSVTGLTLNHAAQIEASPEVSRQNAEFPVSLQQKLLPQAEALDGKTAPVPAELVDWLSESQHLRLPASPQAEWTIDEIYISLPRPGGDAWARLDLNQRVYEYEKTDRGWISWFNDLHKGRNTGAAWSWFIDVFAVASVIFSLTGLLILKFHAANRPMVWPVVGLGFLIPALLAVLFIH